MPTMMGRDSVSAAVPASDENQEDFLCTVRHRGQCVRGKDGEANDLAKALVLLGGRGQRLSD